MSLLGNLFGGNTDEDSLVKPAAFEAEYTLAVTNEFTMGGDNPVLSLNTQSHISVKQEIEKNKLYSTLVLNSISGQTQSENLKPQLEQMLAVAGVSKKITIERNSRGQMVRIANMDELEKDWALWREHRLPDVVAGEKQRAAFAVNYENGLKKMAKNLKSNLNYFIVFPEIYQLKKHVAQGGAGSEMQIHSKLVDDMVIRYRFVPVQISGKGQAIIKLQAEILNRNELNRHHLEELYKSQKDFDISEYGFSIELDYLLEKDSGKVVTGNLFLKEKMHNHLQYLLHIRADEIREPVVPGTEKPANPKRRSFLAD